MKFLKHQVQVLVQVLLLHNLVDQYASSSVYVRLTSSASNGASGNIACTSTGATTVNEATGAGTVSSAPTLLQLGQI